ncbi:MAG: hypothetical protein GY749_48955 [Desulfobacteraceae bacterium]|nr:hypothetical protein [Desulfobacteraceae bacterium]
MGFSITCAALPNFEGEESYSSDFRQAEKKLSDAMNQLEQGNIDKAYSDAKESHETSGQILKKIGINLGKQAKEMKKEIESLGPDTSLKDLLPKLNKIINYANALETGQQKVSLRKLIEHGGTIKKVQEGKERRVTEEIASDISFGKGKYKIDDLSEYGKQKLEKVVADIIAEKNDYIKQFPGYKDAKMIIKINTYGYTDELPFTEGTSLVKELEESGIIPVPKTSPGERRKALNQNLSQFRAETIGKYIEQRISEFDDHSLDIEIKTEFIGRGETVPDGIIPTYQPDDPQRRMCKIDSYCIFE